MLREVCNNYIKTSGKGSRLATVYEILLPFFPIDTVSVHINDLLIAFSSCLNAHTVKCSYEFVIFACAGGAVQ